MLICRICRRPYPIAQGPCCRHCLLALAAPKQRCKRCGHPDGDHRCYSPTSTIAYTQVATDFNTVIQALLHALKRSGDINAGKILSHLFLASLQNKLALSQNTIVCPLPSHFLRRLMRGFVATDFLANLISQQLPISCTSNWLRQAKYRKPQKSKRRADRINAQSPFSWHGPIDGDYHIVLFDDLITTGTTIEQAASAIPKNFTVEAWAIARTAQRVK